MTAVMVTQQKRFSEEDFLSDAEREAIAFSWVKKDYDKNRVLLQRELLPWDGPGKMPQLGDGFLKDGRQCCVASLAYDKDAEAKAYRRAAYVRFIDDGSLQLVLGRSLESKIEKDLIDDAFKAAERRRRQEERGRARVSGNAERERLTMEENVEGLVETGDMKERLERAGKKAVAQKAARKTKTVPGGHLFPKLRDLAAAKGFTVDDKKSYSKVTGTTKGRAVRIVPGNWVGTVGFGIDGPGTTAIAPELAQQHHWGNVQTHINLEAGDDVATSAFERALEQLNAAAPAKA